MSSLPARANLAGTPSNATAKAALASQFDFVAQRLAAGTSGAGTATIAELLSARQSLGIVVPRGHLAGCTLSTAGSSATMSIAAGQAVDSTNTVLMDLSATSKTTSAWAAGSATGGLDTGAIANSTWYHFYAIRRPDTGVVDVIFSTNASAPTLPTNYTQYRRIGSGRTNGSAQWIKFIQIGDTFMLDTPVQDVSTGTPGNLAFNAALPSAPIGVRVEAVIAAGVVDTASTDIAYISDLSTADLAPSPTASPGFSTRNHVANVWSYSILRVHTNTSSQVRVRFATGAATATLKINTLGWIDTRGQFA